MTLSDSSLPIPSLRMYPNLDGPVGARRRNVSKAAQISSGLRASPGLQMCSDLSASRYPETRGISRAETTKISRLDLAQREENNTPCRNRHGGTRLKIQPIRFYNLVAKAPPLRIQHDRAALDSMQSQAFVCVTQRQNVAGLTRSRAQPRRADAGRARTLGQGGTGRLRKSMALRLRCGHSWLSVDRELGVKDKLKRHTNHVDESREALASKAR
jgi:hypothetical protein